MNVSTKMTWDEMASALKTAQMKAEELEESILSPADKYNTLLKRVWEGEVKPLETKIFYLEKVAESARAILTCISDVEDGCVLVSCVDHAAGLREALAKLEEEW